MRRPPLMLTLLDRYLFALRAIGEALLDPVPWLIIATVVIPLALTLALAIDLAL